MATLPPRIRNWAITPSVLVVPALGSVSATSISAIRQIIGTGVSVGAWVIDYSCDSVTAGIKGDGINLWVADANVVGAAPGIAHSWLVATCLGPLGQVCFDKDATGGHLGSVYWSAAAGFTGGTVTDRPTATDEVEITSSSSMLFNGANGTYTVHAWVCTTADQEGFRFVFTHSTAGGTGPIAIFMVERGRPIATALLSDPPVNARWGAQNGTSAGQRSTWGWQSRILGTNRSMSVDGSTPQTPLDPDGDRIIEPSGTSNVTVGFTGWVEDFFFCQDAISNMSTFSDTNGPMGWVAFDQTVFPWDYTTSLGSADIPGGKIRLVYVPEVVTVRYTMRAFNTDISQYVYWTVNDTPDTTGSESPYSPGDLTDIVISRKIHPEA